LAWLYEYLGDRKISLCRELTKKYEEVVRTTLLEAMSHYRDIAPRGEFVLVIEGKDKQDILAEQRQAWEEMPLGEHMEHYERQGMSRKEAMKLVAKDRGLSKREVYAMLC